MSERIFNPQLMIAIEEELRTIYDPEMPVNIYDLGLIYDIDIRELELGNYKVIVTMTLTNPACPATENLLNEIRQKLLKINKIKEVDINLTFDPPWDISKLSDEAKLDLGLL